MNCVRVLFFTQQFSQEISLVVTKREIFDDDKIFKWRKIWNFFFLFLLPSCELFNLISGSDESIRHHTHIRWMWDKAEVFVKLYEIISRERFHRGKVGKLFHEKKAHVEFFTSSCSSCRWREHENVEHSQCRLSRERYYRDEKREEDPKIESCDKIYLYQMSRVEICWWKIKTALNSLQSWTLWALTLRKLFHVILYRESTFLAISTSHRASASEGDLGVARWKKKRKLWHFT